MWGAKDDPELSNWKEFTNIVESLEEEAKLGHLVNAEVVMFTDDSTVEACATKGSSSSPKLLALVVRLFALTSKVGIKVNVVHVAGTRMIAQGTDGVSRGYLGQGVIVTAYLSRLTICPWYVYMHRAVWYCTPIQYCLVQIHSDIPVTKSGM